MLSGRNGCVVTKKRRRRKRFHTGTYTSTKTGRAMVYRSGWELELMQHLDADPEVTDYLYEGVIVPYFRSQRSRKVSKYFVDFKVEYKDGRVVLYEVKSSSFVGRRLNLKKFEACRSYCASKGWTFQVLTQVELKALGLLKPSKIST